MDLRESVIDDEVTNSSSTRSSLFVVLREHALLGVLATLIVWGLYGSSLQLPLFFDDLVQFPYVERYTMFEHWLSSNESPYYRPLTVSIWKLLTLLPTGSTAIFSHALNLFLHALNGVFVGMLAGQIFSRFNPVSDQWLQRQMVKSLVATLYLVLPFHYQAIPWAGALPQILVTTLVLAAVISFINQNFGLAWILTLVAPMAQETGIVLPAIYLLLIAVDFQRSDLGKGIRTMTLFSLPTVIWLAVRFSVSTARDGVSLFAGWESLWQSTTWSLQGLSWPITIFGRYIFPFVSINDLLFIWLLGGGGLLIILIMTSMLNDQKRNAGKIYLVGIGWVILTILPAIVVLPFGYIINSPRLMTLPAVGISLLWGACIVVGMKLVRQSASVIIRIFSVTILALVVGATGVSVQTIREEMRLHALLGGAYSQIVVAAEDEFASPEIPVFINFPSSMAPAEKRFVLGNEGVVFWPQYAPQHTIISTNSSLSRTDYGFVTIEGIRKQQPYLAGIVRPTAPFADFENRTDVIFYNTQYSPNTIRVLKAGQISAGVSGANLGVFAAEKDGFEIQLRGAEINETDLNSGRPLALELQWHVSV
ncbi:MAG: hypothetical protein AAF902_21465, partial [Chloroflexota bacterium]